MGEGLVGTAGAALTWMLVMTCPAPPLPALLAWPICWCTTPREWFAAISPVASPVSLEISRHFS